MITSRHSSLFLHVRASFPLARRSFSVGGCSIKITEDVRKYAGEQGLSESEALESGMEEKAREFAAAGADIYAKHIR